jgi:drug/metabolite transporter (DMT)-like permease
MPQHCSISVIGVDAVTTDNITLESRGNLSGFATIMMWSASGLLLAMTGAIPAFQLALFALPFPFIVTLIKWRMTGEDWRQHFRHPWYIYALGTLGIGGYMVFWFLGFKFAPAFQANLINYMWPFLILLFSFVFLGQKVLASQLLGTAAAFTGLALLFVEGNNFAEFKPSYLLGYGFALLGAIIWALYSVLVRMTKGFGSDVISICCLLSGIPVLICHLMFEEFVVPQGIEWIGIVGLIITRVSYLLWNFAMKYGKVDIIVGVSYFTPLISSVLLIVFAHASHVGLSAILVLSGCIAIAWDTIKKTIAPQFEGESGKPPGQMS